MKRKGGESDDESYRGQKCKKMQQSRSCEVLPSSTPAPCSQTTRVTSTSCDELPTQRSKRTLQVPTTEPSGGERAVERGGSTRLQEECPLDHPLCDTERERVVQKMHETFGARRKVILSGLPSNCREESLVGFLEEYSCTLVSRPKDGSVRLLFTDAQRARVGIALLNSAKFEGHKLMATFGHPDSLLFVGNLPYTYTSDDLLKLFRSHGDVLRCFVVCSPLTGLSKGYGFVEFERKEGALLAKQEMANKVVGPRNLRVDFADNGMQTCPDLQSRTVFVDRLPKGFRDDSRLRELFSKYGTVNFCQVAVTSAGLSRGFAFVDMSTSEEAEHAQAHCNGMSFSGQEIRVSFGMPCRPGACILQHKTSGPPPYHPAGRTNSALPKENQLFVPTSNPLLAKAAMYLPPVTLYPTSPLSERTNGTRCLVVPSSFTFPVSAHNTTTSTALSLPPTTSNPTTTSLHGRPQSTSREQTHMERRPQKRPAPDPDPLDEVSGGLMGVYDRPYIGQHQQGIPYTHPLKRIKMEDVA